MTSKQTGILGEKIAIQYLSNKGYQILDKNFYFKAAEGPLLGEIDIIAKRDNVIYFAEVKTLSRDHSFLAEDKVNHLKKKKIARTAEYWLTKNKIPLASKWALAVIAVYLNKDSKKTEVKFFEV